MKRILAVIALAMMVLSNAGAEEKSVKYTFDDVKSISVSNAFEVYVTKGSSNVVEVKYDADNLDVEKYLDVRYSSLDSKLNLGMKELSAKERLSRKTFNYSKVKVYLQMTDIRSIHVSGASSVRFEGNFSASDLDVDLSGASKLYDLNVRGSSAFSIECSGASKAVVSAEFDVIKLDATGASNITFNGKAKLLNVDLSGASKVSCKGEYDKCDVECSGASNVEMEGTRKNLSLEGSGACKIDAKEFSAKIADVELSGASNVKIQVSDALKYDVTAASKLTYFGEPKLTNVTTNKNVIRGN